jgi:hypothetical protein
VVPDSESNFSPNLLNVNLLILFDYFYTLSYTLVPVWWDRAEKLAEECFDKMVLLLSVKFLSFILSLANGFNSTIALHIVLPVLSCVPDP